MVERTVIIMTVLVFLSVHHVSGQTVVEGFVGGSVILPCTLTGDITWKREPFLILVKLNDQVIISNGEKEPYKSDVNLVENSSNLKITNLEENRDGENVGLDITFTCSDTEGEKEDIQLKLLDPVEIAGVSISQAINGIVTVIAGVRNTLTCSVSGGPNPAPSYSWSVDDGSVSIQRTSRYSFTSTRSMKSIKCTATNRITEESVFSSKVVTATLNVQYLDNPSIPSTISTIENNTVTLRCTANGNPIPSFQWSNSTMEVVSQSAVYTIENVQRSAAGEYTCRVQNTVTSLIQKTELIVQYPPDVSVRYDETTQTLTCRADGVPGVYSFSEWEHRLDGKLLQTLRSESSRSTSTLKLSGGLTFEDTGYYVCQVSNKIKPLQTGKVFITPQSPAIFQKQTHIRTWKEGGDNSISVPFYTYSDTTDVKVMWEKSGESTVLTTHREETGQVRLMIRGQSVSMEGTDTILTLRNVTQSDDGNYTLTVTNLINGVHQSNQITFSVFVRNSITDSPSTSSGKGQPTKQPGLQVAHIAGGVAGTVILILVVVIIIIAVRRRSVNNKNTGMNPEHSPRSPEERVVAQFHNGSQEGGVYQDLTTNLDYVNTADNQPYATLGEKSRDAADYEQCDFPVNETNSVVRESVANVPQYEDVSFSAQEANPQYTDVFAANSENTHYENTNSSTNYYNL